MSSQTDNREAGVTPGFKVCTKCGEKKPATLEYFSKGGGPKGSLRAICKICCNAQYKKWREANPQYFEENREKRLAALGSYYRANKKKYQAANKARYDANKPELLVRNQAWAKAHPEQMRSFRRKWNKANPEKKAELSRNRRARIYEAEGTHTAQDIAKQFDRQKGRCHWCGIKLKKSGKGRFHADHREPLSKGGSNGPENIVCSCPKCNFDKGAKTALDFAGRLF